MPHHNTKGKSKSGLKQYEKGQDRKDKYHFKTCKERLDGFVTKNFYNSHIALTVDPKFEEKLGNASRPIENSTCIILRSSDITKLHNVVKEQLKLGIETGDHDERSIIYRSRDSFELMVWDAEGSGTRINGRFAFSLLKSGENWYMHHLDSTEACDSHAREFENYDDQSDDSESDDEL